MYCLFIALLRFTNIYVLEVTYVYFIFRVVQQYVRYHFLRFQFLVVNCGLKILHHYSYTLGTLLNKIRFTWTQALWYHDSRSDNQGGYWVTKDHQAGQNRTEQDFIMLLKTVTQFKTPELLISGISHLYHNA